MKEYLLILCLIGFVPVTYAEVSIQNDQKYFGDDGVLHIVGEVYNELDAPLHQISIEATLYDESNNIISSKETSSLVNTIMPKMKGPFDLIITDPELKKTNSYMLEVNYKIANPKSQVIDITSAELSRDNLSNLMITGTVANKGVITANMVSVIATLYDKDGNVAAVSRVNPEPDYLRANEEAFFLVPIIDKTQTMEIQEYVLVAESEEYAAVPEFPLSLTLLGGSLLGYVIITKYSNKFTINLISATNLK